MASPYMRRYLPLWPLLALLTVLLVTCMAILVTSPRSHYVPRAQRVAACVDRGYAQDTCEEAHDTNNDH
jgi:hypothetical protein